MLNLRLGDVSRPLEVLCLGAHSDDIEIGCGATLRALVQRGHRLRVHWAVLSAPGERAVEARRSAEAWIGDRAELEVHLAEYPDAAFPVVFRELKARLGHLREATRPDVVFTHTLDDRHQDHRTLAELTWQCWRDHVVLEYEIPKYEGDIGRPNLYVPLDREAAEAKAEHLMQHFGTQRSKSWFSRETFMSLMQLRGIECRAAAAEAFVARKITL